MVTSALELERAHTHPDPTVEISEYQGNLSYPEVPDPPPQNWVEVCDHGVDIPALLAAGHGTYAIFEPFDGQLPCAYSVVSKGESQELKALLEVRETRFRLMERELESPEDLLDNPDSGMSGIRGIFT